MGWESVLDLLERIAEDPKTSVDSQGLLLTTLLKLSDRFGDDAVERITKLIDRFRTSRDLELQQRACE